MDHGHRILRKPEAKPAKKQTKKKNPKPSCLHHANDGLNLNICALNVCVQRVRLWMCCSSSAAVCIPRPAPIFDGFRVLTLSIYSVCVCVYVLTQGHCICPSQGGRRIKCAAAHGARSLLIGLPVLRLPHTHPHPHLHPNPVLLPFQIPPRGCVRHEQHLRVRGGHAGLHQLSMPDQSGAESGLPGNLRPRRALQARPVRGAEDAVARPVVRGAVSLTRPARPWKCFVFA